MISTPSSAFSRCIIDWGCIFGILCFALRLYFLYFVFLHLCFALRLYFLYLCFGLRYFVFCTFVFVFCSSNDFHPLLRLVSPMYWLLNWWYETESPFCLLSHYVLHLPPVLIINFNDNYQYQVLHVPAIHIDYLVDSDIDINIQICKTRVFLYSKHHYDTVWRTKVLVRWFNKSKYSSLSLQ